MDLLHYHSTQHYTDLTCGPLASVRFHGELQKTQIYFHLFDAISSLGPLSFTANGILRQYNTQDGFLLLEVAFSDMKYTLIKLCAFASAAVVLAVDDQGAPSHSALAASSREAVVCEPIP